MSAKTLHRETTDCDHYDGIDGQKIGLGGVITVENMEGNKMDVEMSKPTKKRNSVSSTPKSFLKWVKEEFAFEIFHDSCCGGIGFRASEGGGNWSFVTHDIMLQLVQYIPNPNIEILGDDWNIVDHKQLSRRFLDHLCYEYQEEMKLNKRRRIE